MAGVEWPAPWQTDNGGLTRRWTHAWHHCTCSPCVPSPQSPHGLSVARRNPPRDRAGPALWSGAASLPPCAGLRADEPCPGAPTKPREH